MGFGNFLYKYILKPIAGVATKYGDDILNFATSGAVERQEQNEANIREAEKKAKLMEEMTAKDWSQTQRQAAIAAQQANMDADAVGEQSRSASIDQFQAESAALADSGLGGISEGSPYMATQASLGEMDRSLRDWFSKSSESIAMTGENTAMSIENARFRKKEGEANLDSLKNDIDDMKDARSGYMLDYFGGFLKTASAIHSIGTSVMTGLKMAGADLGNIGLNARLQGKPGGLLSQMRLGAEANYAGMTGDNTFFNEWNPPQADMWGPEARAIGPSAKQFGDFLINPISMEMSPVMTTKFIPAQSSTQFGLKMPWANGFQSPILAVNTPPRKPSVNIGRMMMQ